MSASHDLVIRGATIINHDGIGERDIAITQGRISALGHLGSVKAAEILDAKGLHILPGVIDTQVHFREPGMTHKEDLETGSRSAVAGGVTSVFEMPNTLPLTTCEKTLANKVAAARNRMLCDFAFFVGGTKENIEDIKKLEKCEGAAGIKVFMGSSTGDLLVDDLPSLERIISRLSRRASFHAEDESRLNERMNLRVPGDPSSHPIWRDEKAALIATQNLVSLAEKYRRRVHVLHVSTAEEIDYLKDHKDWATVEVTPQHLTLEAPACYQELGSYAQMNPPIRDRRHKDRIWSAVESGVVDVLGSDHAPHTHEEKQKPYPASHSGMTGVQTLLPIMLDHVNAGRLSLQRLIDLTSHGPQRIFGICGKGRIAVGWDADLSIVDLKRREVITNSWIKSRVGWTPYHGKEVVGWPVGTIVRGQRVMWDGKLVEKGQGQPVRFYEGY
ncbi:MAG: dihydroorotase [Hyphomicrobium sp.]